MCESWYLRTFLITAETEKIKQRKLLQIFLQRKKKATN